METENTMNDYILAVSSTADLRREYLEEHGIPFISYTYTVGEEVFPTIAGRRPASSSTRICAAASGCIPP